MIPITRIHQPVSYLLHDPRQGQHSYTLCWLDLVKNAPEAFVSQQSKRRSGKARSQMFYVNCETWTLPNQPFDAPYPICSYWNSVWKSCLVQEASLRHISWVLPWLEREQAVTTCSFWSLHSLWWQSCFHSQHQILSMIQCHPSEAFAYRLL